MNAGLKATFQFLAKTENRAADDVLVAGLDSPHRMIRDQALRATLTRTSPEGHREVFRRLSTFDEKSRKIISQRAERILEVVSEAAQNPDEATCASACDAIVSFRMYDALPALVAVLEMPGNPNVTATARTILKLTELFYSELCALDDQPQRRDLDTLRKHLTVGLEQATRKYHVHKRFEVVLAFLLVAKQQNIMLRQILRAPDDRSHQAVVKMLSDSSRGGLIRLLLSFLEDPQLPLVVRKIISSRTDQKFVENLLEKVGPKPSKTMADRLDQFDQLEWASPGNSLLKRLDDQYQYNAVNLIMSTSVDRQKVLETVGYLLQEGNPGGRRAAARALAEFDGPEATELALNALNDEDPEVRAHILRQLRPRKVPGAMSLLFRMVGDSSDEVRRALREALPEFTFRQFLANFEYLADELQPVAGHLVRQIDEEAVEQLNTEIASPSPVRRRRGVLVASVMGVVYPLEKVVIKLLSDDDHMVRVAAAKALADCDTMPTWEALRDAMFDSSVAVKEAAEQSLQQISQSLEQQIPEEMMEEVTA